MSASNGGAEGVKLSLGKKRPMVGAAAFGDEEEDKSEREKKVDEIRDLEDGKTKVAKVIPMKEGTAWHRGRLTKESNADKIMEQHKVGASVGFLVPEKEGGKDVVKKEEGVDESLSMEDKAKRALMKDAARGGEIDEGDEPTLGLTIETGKSTGRRLDKKADAEKMKDDMENCGEDPGLNDFADMPITEFGKALMRGMGWKDGEALGGTRKGIIEPIEVRAQPEGLGLGAVPKAKSPPKDRGGRKYIPKPGEERDRREVEKDRIRREAAERTGTFLVGDKVAITGGRHRGLTGEISFAYAHEIMVKLSASGEEVTVDKKDLDGDVSKAKGIKTMAEEERERAEEKEREKKERKKERDRGDRDRDRDRDRGRDRDRDRDRDGDRGGRDRERDRDRDRDPPPKKTAKHWLRPHIKVRIIDASYKGGKYYLKKGRVEDVITRGVCSVQSEDGKLHSEIQQSQLETVLPKSGGTVMVLGGEHVGRLGKLMEKDKKTEVATVQMNGDLAMEKISMDDIAEFLGQDGDHLEDA